MTILIAILAGLKTAFGAVFGLLAKLPWQLWACLLIFLAGGWLFHGGSCRDFACRRTPAPPRVVTSGPYKVLDVPTGASLTVQLGRRRTATVKLMYTEAPAAGTMAEVSAANLKIIAGDEVSLQWERHGIFRGLPGESTAASESRLDGEAVEQKVQPELSGDAAHVPVELGPPATAIVFGQSGIDLGFNQVNNGYADCTADAPKLYQEAKRQAKKAKLGIWGPKK